MVTQIQTTARNVATLEDFRDMLKRSYDLRFDAVVPGLAMRSEGGVLKVKGLDVTDITNELAFHPTAIFDGHIADRTPMPVRYVRQLRTGGGGMGPRLDLLDANFNGWFQGSGEQPVGLPEYEPDERRHLLRTFKEPGVDEPGIARALLSNAFQSIDNYDVLFAVLSGIKAAGVEVKVVDMNLSERRMWVKVSAPQVRALAPDLLQNYRSPLSPARWQEWAVRHGIEDIDPTLPIVFAGLVFANSETGDAALSIAPCIEVLICGNGQTNQKLASTRRHLGMRLEDGIVKYSDETKRHNADLIQSMAADTVSTFLSSEFLEKQVRGITETGIVEVTNPIETIEFVSKKMAFTESEQEAILNYFTRGGLPTAFGVAQAVTALAQVVDDPDVAFDLESQALDVMRYAAEAA